MLNNFLIFNKKNALFKKDDRILVAVSGGVDSIVLLNLFLKKRKRFNLTLGVAHVNYGLRPEADEENLFVKNLAKVNSLPFFEEKVSQKITANLEETARIIRYEFFKKTCENNNFSKVAIAHHKNDRAETFFLNLSRGSGLTGLTSMKPKVNNLIRPLLFTTRDDILKYARENKLEYREDRSNVSLEFKRNIIRHLVLPELTKINPMIIDKINEEIEELSNLQEKLEPQIEKIYADLSRKNQKTVEIDSVRLRAESLYLQTEIIRRAIKEIKKNLRDITRKNVSDILKMTQKPHGTKKIILPGGLISRQIYDKIVIGCDKKAAESSLKQKKLPLNSEIQFGNVILKYQEAKTKKTKKNQPNLVFIDKEKAQDLLIRLKRPGDKIIIKGGTKKLQDLFVDLKVPKEQRETIPIIVTKNQEVVWVPNIRVSHFFSATSQTRKTAILKIVPAINRSEPERRR